MAAAHKQFIHGLIEQSRECVVQVRAGPSLADVLGTGSGSNAASPLRLNRSQRKKKKKKKHKEATDASLPRISSPTMSLVYEARRHATGGAANQNNARSNSDASAMRKHLRKRGVMAASNSSTVPPVSSIETTIDNILGKGGTAVEEISSVKFHEHHQVHEEDAALAQSVATAGEPVDAESAIARTLAAVKGKNAFKNLKMKSVTLMSPDLQQATVAKSPHFAFLDFMHEGNDRRNHARNRTPIHFGDQICFISESSDLPLSIGDNGRTCRVQNLSVGPHMMFTIVDFRNPARHTEVTASDEFWLRVDATLFDPDWGCSTDEYDVSSLLSDTQFFLGCAGSIDDERDDLDSSFSKEVSTNSSEKIHGTAGKYALPRLSPTRQKQARRDVSQSRSHDTFRLVAVKATVPAVEYYGDDKATREYTMETNEHIVRLARWKIATNNESIHGSSSLPKPHNANTPAMDDASDIEEGLLLNCTSVYLSLNHFILEYERDWERAVMRDYSKRCSGVEEATDFLKKRGKRQTLPASWQIRLLRQGVRPESPSKAAANSQAGPHSNSLLKAVSELTASPIEWLRMKHEVMEKNEAKEKRSLVHTAKQSYEQVAKQSNSKLAEIEQRKAQHQLAYFQNRYHAIFAEEADERTGRG